MPTIVELPDKTEIEFPDGMDQMAIRQEIVKAFPKLGEPLPSERPAIPTPGEQTPSHSPLGGPFLGTTPAPDERVQTELATPEQQALTTKLETPLVNLPKEIYEAPALKWMAPDLAEGMAKGTKQVIEGMTSPAGLATVPYMAVGGAEGSALKGASVVGRAIAGVFGVQGVAQLPEAAKRYVEAVAMGDRNAAANAWVGLAATTVQSLGVGALKGLKSAIETPPVIDPTVPPPGVVPEPSTLVKPVLLKESEAELNKLPGGPDAIPERSATPLPVEKPPGDSAEVGARIQEPETPALPQVEREQQPQPPAQESGAVRDVAISPEPAKEVTPVETQTQEKGQEILTPSTTEPAAEGGAPTAAPVIEPTPAGKVEPAGVTQPETLFDAAKNWVKPQSDVLKGFLYSRMDAYDRWKASKGKARQSAKAVLDSADRELEQAKQVHHDAVEQAYNEGKPVPPDVLADYPDLKNLITTKAMAPNTAAAKVKAQVQEVAHTEGQRPAKEVKSELVSRLEEAHQSAPSINDFSIEQQAALKKAQSPDFQEIGNFQYGKRGDEQRAKAIDAVNKKRTDAATAAGFKQITIEIPGDGTFRVWNTKESIGEVLDSARRIKTGKETPSKPGTGRLDAAAALKRDVQDALTVYGDEANAYQRLTSQLDRAAELGIEESQQSRMSRLISELEKRIEAPWEKARTLLQSYERNVDANQGKSPRTLEQETKVKQLQESVDAALYQVEQKLGRKPWEPRKATGEPPAQGAEPMSVGPGAASPSDVTKPGTIVSNMFAAIDRDRAELGKPPMEPGEPRNWDQDQQIATARMNRDPQWIPDLIKEVLDKPRPLLSWENAGMVMQKAFWKAEANNALRRIANAVDDNLAAEELVRAKTDAARFEDALDQMEQAVGRGGTGSEAGRTLQAQKMGLNDDLTLVEMRLEARGKLGGRKLTDAESARIDQIHKEYQQRIAALEKATADADKRRIDAETRATLSDLARVTAESKVPAPHIQKLIDRVGQTIHERANAARERLKGKLFTLSPDVLKDLAEIGADNIWTIGEDFTRWSVKMVSDIGEKVRPHLSAVWEASKKLVSDTWDSEAGPKSKKPAPPKVVELAKQTIKRGDSIEQRREKLTARIVDRFTKNERDKIAPAVQKLARTFVEEGIHDREELIDAVHEVLASVLPDWSRRQTMDAISGYGDYKTLSKDQISVKLRDLKGQMQQIAKLEDMAAGEAPLRTGLERREVTKAQSELIKLVNEAKRKGGYQTTDPTRQLRTALDEVKKRTQSAIDDYEKRISEKDYGIRKTTPIRPDAELLNKQAELKRTRQKWERQKRDWEVSQRANWQKALDRFVRWERAFKLSSPVVFGKLAAAALTRFAETAATEVAGGVMGLAPGIGQVARQAPREGGLNVPAMARGFVAAWRKGMNDAAQTLTKGAADIDVMYGEKLIDKDWANFFGQLHGMMKAPVKRAEFELSLAKRTEHAIRMGLDPSDPLVSARLNAEALNDGYRSIFMQHGFSSDMFNQLVSQMEKSKKYPVAGEVSARVARFLMPVVRVPANIVSETATGIYGSPVASARTMFHAINGTINKLDPVVADSIMRQFKKGSIGLGLMAVGYFSPEMVGGYDWKEKRPAGSVKTAGFQVGGVDIPRWLTHAPWFELMQFGASIRHVKDQHVAKTGADKGISEGMWAAGLGLIEETPFVGQMVRVDKLFQSPAERTYYLGELAKSTLVPQAVIKAAELTDDGTQRKPETIMEHVKSGIPGLRSDVPVKPPPKPTRPSVSRPSRSRQRVPLNP